MKYYAVAYIHVIDTGWIQDYLKNVTPMVEKAGGRYLARTSQIEQVEGESAVPQTMIVIEFPSRDAAEAFYYSEEYQPYKAARHKGSKGDFFFIAGEDIAKR